MVSGFTLPANASADFTLDLDVRKSITVTGSGDSLNYKLRPTMRLMNNISAGHIAGTVDGTLCNAETTASMAVYTYDGFGATVDQEGSDNPPVASSLVSEALDFEIGYLVEGNYTIALACITTVDTAESIEEEVTFVGAQDATVITKQTETYSFQ